MTLRYGIWDLDNCLANDRWRTPLIDWHLRGDDRYQRYNEKMGEDQPAHMTEWNLMRKLGFIPIFLSGRPEKFRDTTEAWIAKHLGVHGPVLFMRPNGDQARPADLKERMLKNVIEVTPLDPRNIVAAFDDVLSIVDMYRRYGIPAIQLAIHDPAMAYTPEDL